jgi:hypothetical protein
LFSAQADKPEIVNLNRLFNSKCVVWREGKYVEVEEEEDTDAFVDTEEEGFTPYDYQEEDEREDKKV